MVKNHRRRFRSFYTECKMNNKRTADCPRKKYYDENELINVEFNVYSNKEDMTFNHYLTQPKSMLQTTIVKILDKNPQKLKILENNGLLYYNYLIVKYYGSLIRNPDDNITYCVMNNHLNTEPKETNDEFREFLRYK